MTASDGFDASWIMMCMWRGARQREDGRTKINNTAFCVVLQHESVRSPVTTSPFTTHPPTPASNGGDIDGGQGQAAIRFACGREACDERSAQQRYIPGIENGSTQEAMGL